MLNRKSATTFIFITVIIDMLGIGLAWPILPKLVEELTGGTISEAASVYGLLVASYALMQFFFSPVMGVLSDRFGRRPILLLALAGLGADYVVLAVAPTIAWIVVGRLIAGILGATVSTANAYIADITPAKDRAAAFGMLGAAFGIGFILGPLIGGVLGDIDLRYPFWLAAGLSFANVIFGYFVLPESLTAENRRKIRLKEANPFGALLQIRKYQAVGALLAALFLAGMAQRGLENIWVLWTDVQFGWGVKEAGYSLAFVGVSMALVQGVLVKRLVPIFGERRIVYYGYMISAIAFLALPFVSAGWLIYPGIFFHILGWGAASPALQAIMSKAVPADQQGLLQGTLGSINNLGAIIGPLMASQIFTWFTGPHAPYDLPGAWFLVGAFLMVIALVILSIDGARFRRRKAAQS